MKKFIKPELVVKSNADVDIISGSEGTLIVDPESSGQPQSGVIVFDPNATL